MMDDQVIENPEEEEEHEREEEEEETDGELELQSEIEKLIEVMLPPISDKDIDALALHLEPLPPPREEMIEKIIAAIVQGKTKQR